VARSPGPRAPEPRQSPSQAPPGPRLRLRVLPQCSVGVESCHGPRHVSLTVAASVHLKLRVTDGDSDATVTSR
jgi:hypothetical protein